jgi:tRNA threonylcarbamoyl adenosine modification protein YeaZ
MRLLAIDTASDACSVGVVDGDRVFALSGDAGRSHAERLMGMIATAMAEAGLAFADLDRIAVTVGPGSFTGVRVGIAAARGLALVAGTPAIGLTTLAVHAAEARQALGPRPVLAVVAAGRGELYGAVYDADGRELEPPRAASAQALAAFADGGTVVAGSGADLILAALPMDTGVTVAHRRLSPSVGALCMLALRAPAADGPPRPLYLRPPDAKPQTAAGVERA